MQNPICDCGISNETAEHYFFECGLYTTVLYLNLINNFHVLTSGSPDYGMETNQRILQSVLKFIKDSHEFD